MSPFPCTVPKSKSLPCIPLSCFKCILIVTMPSAMPGAGMWQGDANTHRFKTSHSWDSNGVIYKILKFQCDRGPLSPKWLEMQSVSGASLPHFQSWLVGLRSLHSPKGGLPLSWSQDSGGGLLLTAILVLWPTVPQSVWAFH